MEILSQPFMRNALAAGVLVSLVAGYYGVFVVQRRLSFLGAGLGHAAFGGVGLALLIGAEPLWIAGPFTILVALGMNWIAKRTRLTGDTAIGILFAISVALGITFLSMRSGYTQDAFSYLFGSILTVSTTDVGIAAALTALTAALVPMWGRWAYATFDRDLAVADGLPVDRDDYVLLGLLGATVAFAVQMVGILLVAAFLVIPAATARLVAQTLVGMTTLSAAIGVVSTVSGLLASYFTDTPAGATIVIVQALIFALVMLTAGGSRR